MVICDRLRELREEKKLSQGDIEKRTGLLRCYISRVENGHTVPTVETLEKMARALEVPLYRLTRLRRRRCERNRSSHHKNRLRIGAHQTGCSAVVGGTTTSISPVSVS